MNEARLAAHGGRTVRTGSRRPADVRAGRVRTRRPVRWQPRVCHVRGLARGVVADDGRVRWQDGEAFDAVAPWEALEPGPVLAERLAVLEPADLDGDELLEAYASFERLASWAAAGQSRIVSEQIARARTSREVDEVAVGLALRLGLTKHATYRRTSLAVAVERFPQLHDALATGLLDRDKVLALAETGVMTDAERSAAIRDLLPLAPRLSHRELADRMRWAEIAADPAAAAERAQRARDGRAVSYEAAPETMAWITALLPADEAALVWKTIDTAARAMRRAPGEARTLDQCRADAFVAFVRGQLLLQDPAEDVDGDGVPDGASEGTAGSADEPDTDEQGGDEPDTDQPEGADPRPAAASAPPAPEPPASSGDTRCGRPAWPTLSPGLRRRARAASGTLVTVAATTLLGLDDAPGELDGYGAIPAELARRLAAESGTWRRLLTDPSSGILTDYSTTAYAPGEVLRAAVVARDRACTFVGCRQPAARCELDHKAPYDHADPRRRGPDGHGQTCAGNLHPLCAYHHGLKTAGVLGVRTDPAGGTVWVLNGTGHTTTVPATVTDPTLRGPAPRDGARRAGGSDRDGRHERDDGEPPF